MPLARLDWWRILADADMWAVFPGGLADPADRHHVTRRMSTRAAADGFDLPHAVDIAYTVVEELCGMPGPAAVTLAREADRHRIDVDGWAAQHGVDLFGLPIRRGLALMWRYACVANTDEREAVISPLTNGGGSKHLRRMSDQMASMRRRMFAPARAEDRFDPQAEAELVGSLMQGMTL